MECISTSYAPMIVQPDSGHDWAQQHILGEQYRLDHTKQQQPPSFSFSPSSPRSDETSTNTNTTLSPKQRSSPHRQGAGRRALPLPLPLPLPTSAAQQSLGGGVQKKPVLKTPVKTTDRTRDEWEALLTQSIASLRGAYARMEHTSQPPPAPRRQSLGAARRLQCDQPDVAGLDRTEIASRALQVAAGCSSGPGGMMMFSAPLGGLPAYAAPDAASDASSCDEAESSGTEEEDDYLEDAPATPGREGEGDEMHIDPRLFS